MKRVGLFRHFLLITLPLCAAGLCAAGTQSGYTPAPFSDYQPILDRMPFGALPPNFGQAAAAAPSQTDAQVQAEQQKLAKQINMSCINVTPDGATAIGFTDLEAKPPVNFYLLVGTSAGGWTVVNADYDLEVAVLEKDGVTINLKLGKGLIDDAALEGLKRSTAGAPAAAAQPPVAQASAVSAPLAIPGLIRRPSQAGLLNTRGIVPAQMAEMMKTREEIAKLKESGGDVGSYMERFRERKRLESEQKAASEAAARAKLQELAKKITQDELAKKEREMNLSLIEQGAKPVSDIQLTPEEEQALVDKGVLAR